MTLPLPRTTLAADAAPIDSDHAGLSDSAAGTADPHFESTQHGRDLPHHLRAIVLPTPRAVAADGRPPEINLRFGVAGSTSLLPRGAQRRLTGTAESASEVGEPRSLSTAAPRVAVPRAALPAAACRCAGVPGRRHAGVLSIRNAEAPTCQGAEMRKKSDTYTA
jgi:hypothetical protein